MARRTPTHMKIRAFTSDQPVGDACWLGIDPSLTGFGICLIDAPGNYEAEVWSPLTRGAERLADLRRELSERIHGIHTLKDVAMEGTVVQSRSASVLGELSGVVREMLYSEFGIHPVIVPPTALKKFVSGKGTTQKSAMMMTALKKWGVEIPEDNAVDAYGLARLCRGRADNAYEAEVVMKMSDPKYRS